MSETPRVYSRDLFRTTRRVNSFWKRLLGFIVVLFLVFLGWVFWISEDSHQVQEFLPATANFQIFSPNIMQNYEMLVNSPIWNFLDENPEINEVRKILAGERGIPVWVIKHLICDFLFFSAEDFSNANSYLVIIKLSRLGCVLENLYSVFGDVEYDWAGGIGLYHSKPLGICHTRKGRIVILSPSRDQVIKAVTKTPNEKSPLPKQVGDSRSYEGLIAHGKWKPSFSIKGIEIPDSSFSLSLSSSEITLNAELKLNYDADEPWIALLSELTSGPLKDDSSDAMLFLTTYTNIPISTWLNAMEAPVATLEIQSPSQQINTDLPNLLKSTFRLFQNSFFIKVDTFYFDEIIPFIPRVAIGGKISPNEWNKYLERILNTPVMFLGEPQKFRPGKESGEYVLSLLGSGQTDFIFSVNEEDFVITNAPEFKKWAFQQLDDNTSTIQGNVLLKVKPSKFAENILKGIEPLLVSKVIQIKDEHKFNNFMNKLKLIEAITATASFQHDMCKLNAKIKLSPLQ